MTDPTFVLASGKLRVTDPCYTPDTWCATVLDGAKNGVWHASVAYVKNEGDEQRLDARIADLEDQISKSKPDSLMKSSLELDLKKYIEHRQHLGRVSVLSVVHEEYASRNSLNFSVVPGIDIGVDSGQAGFFDDTAYRLNLADKATSNTKREDMPVFEAFYDKIMGITGTTEQFGVLDFGTVSSTGYGDGGYPLLVAREDGVVIAASIIFIDPNEEEEDDDDDYDDEEHDGHQGEGEVDE